MRLAFVEVRAMVCLPQETYQSFASQSSPEPKAPALERGKERARVGAASPRQDAMRSSVHMRTLLLPVTVLGSSASLAQSKLDASILSYDGKDFTRTETTLMQEGKAAVGTKLEANSPAYKALAEGHSYTGPVTVFGKNYQGNYAPLIGADGKVTGALFVGVPK